MVSLTPKFQMPDTPINSVIEALESAGLSAGPGPVDCLARWRCCRSFVSPGAGVYGVKDSQLGLVDGPGGVIQGIGRVFLRVRGVSFCLFDVMLVAFAVDAVLHRLHFRGGIGLHRLPLALRAVGGLLGLLLRGALAGIDICLSVAEARLDLSVSFLSAFVEGTLQIRCSLL